MVFLTTDCGQRVNSLNIRGLRQNTISYKRYRIDLYWPSDVLFCSAAAARSITRCVWTNYIHHHGKSCTDRSISHRTLSWLGLISRTLLLCEERKNCSLSLQRRKWAAVCSMHINYIISSRRAMYRSINRSDEYELHHRLEKLCTDRLVGWSQKNLCSGDPILRNSSSLRKLCLIFLSSSANKEPQLL